MSQSDIVDELGRSFKKAFHIPDAEQTPTKKVDSEYARKRLEEANESFRKRAESEKLAANRKLGAKPAPKKGKLAANPKLGAKPAPKKGKSTRKRVAKSY